MTGDTVRLKGKPSLARKVLKSQWHRHRHQFVYIIETSAKPPFEPYWFLNQLQAETPRRD